MSKKARARLLDILIFSGFNPKSCFRVCRVPMVRAIRVTATAVDAHGANLYFDETKKSIQTKNVEILERPALPQESYVESYVINDGSGPWSMSRSKLVTTFTDKSTSSLIFGEAGSGPETDKRIPLIHRLSLPMAPGYPELESIKLLYPPPVASS